MARPPLPVEVKRRRGRTTNTDSGGRPLPELAQVTILPAAHDVPEPPELGDEGREVWRRAWSEAITWLSPDSDLPAVLDACRIADDLAIARRRYHATTDPADGRMVATLAKSFMEALSALGFTPVARSRLGVAEVKRVSALENLISSRQAR